MPITGPPNSNGDSSVAKPQHPLKTARLWSGDKGSALDSFRKTDRFVPGVLEEIDECLEVSETDEEIADLKALRAYAERKSREPVKTSYEQFSNDTASGCLIIVGAIVIILLAIFVWKVITGGV